MHDMAGHYRFFPIADARQDAIYQYTLEHWGEKQAERYIFGLHEHLQQIADQKLTWHKIPARFIRSNMDLPQAYVTRYEKHYIFFKKLDKNTVGIMSIMHEAMDIPSRLKEDLELLIG
jgi:plasmid stabilization system protein ParE